MIIPENRQHFWEQEPAKNYAKQRPYAPVGKRARGQSMRAFDAGMGMFNRGSRWAGDLYGQVMPMLKGDGATRSSKFGFPQAGDPNVMEHIKYLRSGSEKNLDRLKAQKSLMGRGGPVAGALHPDAQFAQSATQQLAGDYSQMYDQAMGYGMKGAELGLQGWMGGLGALGNALAAVLGAGGDALGAAQGFGAQELAAAQAGDQRAWQQLMGQREDFMGDLDWRRGEWERQFKRRGLENQRAQQQEQYGMDRSERMRSEDLMQQLQRALQFSGQAGGWEQWNSLRNALYGSVPGAGQQMGWAGWNRYGDR